MRIAVFTPYLPWPPDTGGKIRSYHLLLALAARFEVDLYTVDYGEAPPEPSIETLRKHCREITVFRLDKSWRTRDRLRRVLAPLPRSVDYFHTLASLAEARQRLQMGGYDLIVADEICMAPYAELAPGLPRLVARQKVDHLHYREMASARPWGVEKWLDWLESIKLRRYEKAKMPLFQAFVACSEQDKALIQPDAPQAQSMVIPNGVDLQTFVALADRPRDPPVLLYIGSMNYYPNIDAATWFFEAIYEPIRQAVPGVQVQVVGHAPPPDIQRLARSPDIEITGSVPDVRPYYAQASVFIVPLRLGGGTRLKIVEAMAMGIPVVSTTVGAEGLDTRPGEDIWIANDPMSFAQGVLHLLSDAELRRRLIAGGRDVARRYDWTELIKPYADLAAATVQRWTSKRTTCASPG